MTIRYTAILDLHGFPENDGQNFIDGTEFAVKAAIEQALRQFRSPLQRDVITVSSAPVKKPVESEIGDRFSRERVA